MNKLHQFLLQSSVVEFNAVRRLYSETLFAKYLSLQQRSLTILPQSCSMQRALQYVREKIGKEGETLFHDTVPLYLYISEKPKKDSTTGGEKIVPRSQVVVVIVMASQEYHKLFQNANEGQEEGQIQGNLPEWMNQEKMTVIYNGPVSISC